MTDFEPLLTVLDERDRLRAELDEKHATLVRVAIVNIRALLEPRGEGE